MITGSFHSWIVAISNVAVLSGANILVQSTIIIGFALLLVSVFKAKGAVFQSLVLKLCLSAVIFAFPFSFALSMLGIEGFSLGIPLLNTPKQHNTATVSGAAKKYNPMREIENKPIAISAEDDKSIAVKRQNVIVKGESPAENNNRGLIAPEPPKTSLNNNSAQIVPVSKNVKLPSIAPKNPDRVTTAKNKLAIVYILLTVAWIGFSAFLMLRLFTMLFFVYGWCKNGIPAKPEYQRIFMSVADEMNIKPPMLKQNLSVVSPFLAGIIHPCIVFPLGEKEKLYDIRSAFLHELYHLKRHDHLWNIFGHLAAASIPFQPLMRVLAHRIGETADYVCDDFVLHFDADSGTYAMSLLNISAGTGVIGHERDVSVGMSSRKSNIGRRIQRLFDDNLLRPLKNSFRLVTVVAASFLCSVIFTGFVGFKGRKASADLVTDREPAKSVSFSDKRQSDNAPVNTNESRETTGVAEKKTPEPSTPADLVTTAMEITVDNNPGKEIDGIPGHINEPENLSKSPDGFETAVFDVSSRESEKSNFITDSFVFEKPSVSMSVSALENADTGDVLSGLGFGAHSLTGSSSSVSIPSGCYKLIQPVENFESLTEIDKVTRAEDFKKISTEQFDPIWSPDGKYISFTDGEYGIWVVPAAGGEPVLVYDNYNSPEKRKYGAHLSSLKTFCFSPDSESILFEIWTVDEVKGTVVIFGDNITRATTAERLIPVMYSANIKTGKTEKVTENGISGEYSKDGRYFGYRRFEVITYDNNVLCEQNFVLSVTNNYTNETVYLTDRNYEIKEFAFSEDNTFIVASLKKKGDNFFQLYRISIETHEMFQLTFYDKDTTFSDISAGDNWVRFMDYSTLPGETVYLDTDTGVEERITLPDRARRAIYSSDNKNVCYVFAVDDNESAFNLYTSPIQNKPAFVKDTVASQPATFSLKGNFPNPFNMSTTIEFSLPSEGRVNLLIYNSLGQKVRHLVSDNMSPGAHHVVWDGRDDNGNIVSSGVYISSLSMGNYRMTKKMTLLK